MILLLAYYDFNFIIYDNVLLSCIFNFFFVLFYAMCYINRRGDYRLSIAISSELKQDLLSKITSEDVSPFIS